MPDTELQIQQQLIQLINPDRSGALQIVALPFCGHGRWDTNHGGRVDEIAGI